MELLERLKQETSAQHAAVEDVVPLTDPRLDVEEYKGYLGALHPFYAHMEGALRKVPGLKGAVPDLDKRWKLPLLEKDLRELGQAVPQTGHVPIPIIDTQARAMGVLYVLEGSTLGGQILVRTVEARLGDQVRGATKFLAAYGPETGVMWRALGDSVRRTVQNADDQQAAIAAAKDTFAAFHAWLQAHPASAFGGARHA